MKHAYQLHSPIIDEQQKMKDCALYLGLDVTNAGAKSNHKCISLFFLSHEWTFFWAPECIHSEISYPKIVR